MLCLSGFELYSRWVPLVLFVCFRRIERMQIVYKANVDLYMPRTKLNNKGKLCMIMYI